MADVPHELWLVKSAETGEFLTALEAEEQAVWDDGLTAYVSEEAADNAAKELGNEFKSIHVTIAMLPPPAAPTHAVDDAAFLEWVADRLVHIHGENRNVDFVRRLRRMAENMKEST